MFYSAWMSQNESFDPAKHCRQDIEIFDVSIVHREGEYAYADVGLPLVQDGAIHPPEKPYLVIVKQEENGTIKPLFRGRIWRMPRHIRHRAGYFKLLAAPQDADQRLKDLRVILKKMPFWDPLFVEPSHQDDIDELLEARGAFLYWDRWTHEVRLSPMNKGREHHDIASDFFKDSLKVDIKNPPFEAVKMILSAEWTQVCAGSIDLGPSLGHKFAEGRINTFTPQDFQKRWERALYKLNRTGYHIEYAQLSEFYPPFTGILNLYPALSKPVWQVKNKNTKSTLARTEQIQLKRTWFNTTLIVSWLYKQHRRECVHIFLKHNIQCALGTRGIKTLHFKMQSPLGDIQTSCWTSGMAYKKGDHIHQGGKLYEAQNHHTSGISFIGDQHYWRVLKCSDNLDVSASSFFNTTRGNQAIQHALERARSYLEYSARCIWVTVSMPFEKGWAMTPDDQVTLTDDRLPGGTMTGKIVAYKLCIEGETGQKTVTVTIAASIGKKVGDSLKIFDNQHSDLYVVSEYGGGLNMSSFDTPSGLAFSLSNQSVPGLPHTHWTPEDILDQVLIQNHPHEQHDRLLQETVHTSHRAIDILKECPTMMKIFLKDLRTQGVVEHHLYVDICNSWSSPAHIHMETL